MAGFTKKICLLGDGAVGKTSLIRRFVFDDFSDDYIRTFGTKVTKKVVSIGEDKMTLMIWDILGQKRHESLHSAYYKGASGVIVVCDLTRRETFTGIDQWTSSLESVAGKVPIVLLGNKSDLEEERTVAESALEKKSSRLDCSFLLTSAKTGKNVEEAFKLIAELIIEKEGQ